MLSILEDLKIKGLGFRNGLVIRTSRLDGQAIENPNRALANILVLNL